MRTVPEYLAWLDNLKERSIDEKTQKSIKKLNSLLTALDSRNVFEMDASKIFQRLDNLILRVEEYPNKTKYFIDSCFASIINIAAKFYRLVTKNYYINEWTGWGISLGSMAGAVIMVVSQNVALLGLGIGIGLSIGLGIGSQLDKKALKDGRIIFLE